MLRGLICLGFIFVSCSVRSHVPLNCPTPKKQTVKFIKAIDGDTFVFNVSGIPPIFGNNLRVQLRGVDAADLKGTKPCSQWVAKKAKSLVDGLLRSAKSIALKNIIRSDSSFSVIADVYYDGINLGSVLMRDNLAIRIGAHKKQHNWCKP